MELFSMRMRRMKTHHEQGFLLTYSLKKSTKCHKYPCSSKSHVLSSDRDDEVLLEGQLVSCQRPSPIVWQNNVSTLHERAYATWRHATENFRYIDTHASDWRSAQIRPTPNMLCLQTPIGTAMTTRKVPFCDYTNDHQNTHTLNSLYRYLRSCEVDAPCSCKRDHFQEMSQLPSSCFPSPKSWKIMECDGSITEYDLVETQHGLTLTKQQTQSNAKHKTMYLHIT